MRKTSLLLLGVVLFAVGCSTDSNEEKMTNTKQISSFENNTNYNVYAGVNALHNMYVQSQGGNIENRELSSIVNGVENVAMNSDFTMQYNFTKEKYRNLNTETIQRIMNYDLNVLRESNYSDFIVSEVERVINSDSSDLSELRKRISKSEDIGNEDKNFLIASLSGDYPPYGIDPDWRKSNIVALLYYSKQSKLNVATATTVLKVVLD